MITLLTIDGVEEVDYAPSDSELRAYVLDDAALYGFVLGDTTWIRCVSGGFWSFIAGRRVDVAPAALGWCYVVDGRGCWTSELARVSSEVYALYPMWEDDCDD